jgi:hypothetical protein
LDAIIYVDRNSKPVCGPHIPSAPTNHMFDGIDYFALTAMLSLSNVSRKQITQKI